jgi:3-hydroxy-5-phosphonooxypentane-2,4-dione thiolase
LPEIDDTAAHRFYTDKPQLQEPFSLKGSTHLDWGMQHRLARIFDPQDNRTVMLAIDHGYFQGPTSGLERIDIDIVPRMEHADAVMLTRGALRAVVPPTIRAGIVVRASGGPSVLKGDLSDEVLGLDRGDAVRLDACALAVQVFVGGEHETASINNMMRLVDFGNEIGIPVLAVTAVGRELTRDARYLRLATRICAELGARIVKTYFCEEGFDTVTASCPVPLVMAGGKKLPELDALKMAHGAVSQGAAGVDMGRNIFQSADPVAMMLAVRGVVHAGLDPQDAYDRFLRGRLGPSSE